MKEEPAYTKQGRFETPPIGEDWLWWHPDEPETSHIFGYMRQFSCGRCDVRWHQEVTHHTKRIRCFCCGKFVRKPKI